MGRKRPRQGVYHADHIPSRAAVELYLQSKYPELDYDRIKILSGKVAAIHSSYGSSSESECDLWWT